MQLSPKEKAQELAEKMQNSLFSDGWYDAKCCAIIACDEILNVLFQHHKIDYWKEVKQEIEKL